MRCLHCTSTECGPVRCRFSLQSNAPSRLPAPVALELLRQQLEASVRALSKEWLDNHGRVQ